MTDEQAPAGGDPTPIPADRRPAPAGGGPAPDPTRPDYKGAPLDPERGPGLGCFWLQTVVFLILFVLTPFGVINGWPTWLTTTMFVVTLILLLFVGQTVIFLLRLVAADRRTRRRPLREGARPTVGDLSAAPAERTEPAGSADAVGIADAADAGTAGSSAADEAGQGGPPEGDGPPAVRQ